MVSRANFPDATWCGGRTRAPSPRPSSAPWPTRGSARRQSTLMTSDDVTVRTADHLGPHILVLGGAVGSRGSRTKKVTSLGMVSGVEDNIDPGFRPAGSVTTDYTIHRTHIHNTQYTILNTQYAIHCIRYILHNSECTIPCT